MCVGSATHYHTLLGEKVKHEINSSFPPDEWVPLLRTKTVPPHHYNYRKHQTLAGSTLHLSGEENLIRIN